MKKVILQQAYEEFDKAVEYYEGKQAGLGLRLMGEVDNHVRWIQENPTIPRIRKSGYRRVNLKTYPYYIAYMIHESTLWMGAIQNSTQSRPAPAPAEKRGQGLFFMVQQWT